MQQYKINGKVHLTFPNGHCCYKNGYWFFTSNFVFLMLIKKNKNFVLLIVLPIVSPFSFCVLYT